MPAICPMCAEDVSEQAAVCPHCGHVLRVVPPPIQAPTAPALVAAPSRPSRAGFGAQYLVPLVLTLATLVAGGVWLASRGSRSAAATLPAADAAVAFAPDVSPLRAPPPPGPSAPAPSPPSAPTPATDEAPALGPEEPSPTDENFPEGLDALRPRSVSASSFIRNPTHPHGPEQAFDGDLGTAWNEGARGPGEGEWIEADLGAPHRIERVTFTTGWDYSSERHGDLFPLNSHLRRVRVTFDGRHAIERDVGVDERRLVLDNLRVRARTVRIEATTVWPGTRWPDLSIAEVALAGRPTGPAEARAQPVMAAPSAGGDAPPPSRGAGTILVPHVPSESAPEPPPRAGGDAPPPAPPPTSPRAEESHEQNVEPHSVMTGWPCRADQDCMNRGFCSRNQGGLCSQHCESDSDCVSGLCIRGECWRPCHASLCEGARCVTSQDDTGRAVQICRR